MNKPELWHNNRLIVDVEINYRGIDSFITAAAWDDTGEQLSDEELSEVQDKHADWVYDRAVEHYGYGPK